MTNIILEFKGQYRWLSNFHKCRILYDGIMYPSVEHAYQAAKAPEGSTLKEEIARMSTPGEAKRTGHMILLEPGWNAVRISIMEKLIWEKFSDYMLALKLIETGTALLVEGNRWHDTFWGFDLDRGYGENRLGRALMKTRSELRKECP